MGELNYLEKNKELNRFWKGVLLSLWVIIPSLIAANALLLIAFVQGVTPTPLLIKLIIIVPALSGTIILTVKILNRTCNTLWKKILILIGLFIPYINLIVPLILLVLIYQRIGRKFITGLIISFIVIPAIWGVLSAIVTPQMMKRTTFPILLMKSNMHKISSAAYEYAQENGAPPENLEALVPKYLKSIPKGSYGDYEYNFDGEDYEIKGKFKDRTFLYSPPSMEFDRYEEDFETLKKFKDEELILKRIKRDMHNLSSAVNKYSRKNDAFPSSLQALVPSYLKSIPKGFYGDYEYNFDGEDYEIKGKFKDKTFVLPGISWIMECH